MGNTLYYGFYCDQVFIGTKATIKGKDILSIHYFSFDTWQGVKGYKKIYHTKSGINYVKINGKRAHFWEYYGGPEK